jgi:hypothetical protein
MPQPSTAAAHRRPPAGPGDGERSRPRALLANGDVAPGGAGNAANTPLALEDVAVDLAAEFENRFTDATRGALAAFGGNAATTSSPQFRPTEKDRVVVLRGPGTI